MSQICSGNNQKGISVIEILIATAVLGIALVSLLGLINSSLHTSSLIKQNTQVDALIQETMEAIRNFRDNTVWDSNGLGVLTKNADYYPRKAIDGLSWELVPGEETIDEIARKVVFYRAYRDENDDISENGIEDPDTLKAVATVSWPEKGKTKSVEVSTYFTNWKK